MDLLMDERLALLTGRDVNINGPRLSCAVKLSSAVSLTALPFRPCVDAHLVLQGCETPVPPFPEAKKPSLTFGVVRFEPDVQRDSAQAHGESQPVQQTHFVSHHRRCQEQSGHFLQGNRKHDKTNKGIKKRVRRRLKQWKPDET